MKTAIVIANGIKQVMLTPETPEEKQALLMITPDDDIKLEVKRTSFFDDCPPSAAGYMVAKSSGGAYRAYTCEESIMLILTPKEKKE